jgi:diguanylate cyclase (GGDEF)-like protein/PAS domain S-box-containing protein
LRSAVDSFDFTLVYQAQLSLLTGRVTSFEALLRWQHPVWGDVPPASFIAVAERVGLMDRIDRWVLQRSCEDAMNWPADIGLSVNISATQLGPALIPEVLSALARSGLPAQRLELEITETISIASLVTAAAVLDGLRQAGVRIAIDDFDVGCASFNYLISLPFDTLKLDRSVIAHLGSAHHRASVAQVVVQSIATMCRDLGVSCVGEGVERLCQLEVLTKAGFSDAQGFFLAPPVAPGEIPEVLREINSRARPAVRAPAPNIPDLDFFQVAETAGDIIVITDAVLDAPGPKILYVNPAFTRLTGFTAAETTGQSPRMMQGPGTSRLTLDKIGAALRSGQPVHEKLLNYAKSGAPYWLDLRIVGLRDRGGRITQYAAIQRDVTMDSRRADELEELADRDTLTGIPNRRALLAATEAEVAAVHGQRMAGAMTDGPSLALINIDHFKKINDAFGHQTGDAVLCGLADRLAEGIRRADVFGRLGGEEFVICMPRVPLMMAAHLAERIRSLVEHRPFDTPSGPVGVTISIGVAALTLGDTARDLIKQASLALKHAKSIGRNTVQHEAQA